MNLFALLASINPQVTPDVCKVYLHQPVQDTDRKYWLKPLDLWLDGKFDEFQRVQKSNHFTAPYVISLIKNERGGYMFAGVHRVRGHTVEGDKWRLYDMARLPEFEVLNGHLHVVCLDKAGQSPCFTGGYMTDRLVVREITEHPYGAREFPGYRNVALRKPDLDRLIQTQDPRWKAPLTAVKGIYLISDMVRNLLYVGMASGSEGFWGRWTCYSKSGHGGNKKMIALLDELSGGHSENFVFSILEIADLNVDKNALMERESHWKALLHTKISLNAN